MKFRRPSAASTGRRRLAPSERRPASFEYYGQGQSPTKQVAPRRSQSGMRFSTTSWLNRFGLVLLAVVVLAAVFNALTLTPHSKVMPLKSGPRNLFLHDQSAYQAAADDLLSSSVWNRNKLTINTGSINSRLMAQFPELTQATVALPLLAHRPNVYVETAQPAALLKSGSDTYLLDSTGRALLKNPPATTLAPLKLPVLVDQSGLRVNLGHQVITSHNIAFIQTVLRQLAVKHVRVADMTLPPGSSELDVRIAGQAYFVKFNLQSDTARLQAGTYLAAAAQLQRDQQLPSHYIDVRVPGRAYYQ